MMSGIYVTDFIIQYQSSSKSIFIEMYITTILQLFGYAVQRNTSSRLTMCILTQGLYLKAE